MKFHQDALLKRWLQPDNCRSPWHQQEIYQKMAMLEYQYKENRGGFYPRSTAINMLCLNLHWDLAGRATLCITQKFNYVFYTLDLPDLYDE